MSDDNSGFERRHFLKTTASAAAAAAIPGSFFIGATARGNR